MLSKTKVSGEQENKAAVNTRSDDGRKAVHSSTMADNRSTSNSHAQLQSVVDNSAAMTAQRTLIQRIENKVYPGPSSTGVVQRELEQEDFDAVESAVEALKAEYPLDEYFYIGLGKSPTPIIAYLEAEGQEGIVNMPLSKFTHAYDRESARSPLFSAQLSKAQKQELQRHFDRFIPSKDELQGRKLLLIDFVTSGRSLISTQKHIEQYLIKKYGPTGVLCWRQPGEIPPELVPLALYQHGGNTPFIDEHEVPKLELSEEETSAIGDTDKFKPRAEFPADFRVDQGEKTADIVRSGEYDNLVDEIKDKMAADQGLVELLG